MKTNPKLHLAVLIYITVCKYVPFNNHISSMNLIKIKISKEKKEDMAWQAALTASLARPTTTAIAIVITKNSYFFLHLYLLDYTTLRHPLASFLNKLCPFCLFFFSLCFFFNLAFNNAHYISCDWNETRWCRYYKRYLFRLMPSKQRE